MHCRRAVLQLKANAISFLLYWHVNKNTLLLCLIQSNLIGRNGNFNRIDTFAFIKCTAVFRLHEMANRSTFSWLRFPVILYSSLSVIKLESLLHFNFQKKCTETFMSCTHPIHNIKEADKTWARVLQHLLHSEQQQTSKWQMSIAFGLEHNFRLIYCLQHLWTHLHTQNYSNVIKNQTFHLGFLIYDQVTVHSGHWRQRH